MKMWNICVIEQYPAIQIINVFQPKWIELQGFVFSEMSQLRKMKTAFSSFVSDDEALSETLGKMAGGRVRSSTLF